MESSGAIAMRPKKEGAVLRRELERLQKYLGGLKNMRRLPDVVVLVDQRRESNKARLPKLPKRYWMRMISINACLNSRARPRLCRAMVCALP